jgi:hypothetical protein
LYASETNPLSLKKEYGLSASKKRVLGRLSVPKKEEEVTGGWRKL